MLLLISFQYGGRRRWAAARSLRCSTRAVSNHRKRRFESVMTPRAASLHHVNAYGRLLTFASVALSLALGFVYGPAAGAQTAKAPAAGRISAKSSSPDALSSPALEKKVAALFAKMTLEEKIGQLVQYSAGQATGPSSGRTDDRDMIRKGQVGSLFNVTGARATNELQRIAVENSRLHIPLIFGLDVIHGYRTTFPIPLGLAATWDPSVVEKASRVAAQEASAG